MIIRRCNRSSDGWNNGDLDVAFQLFCCGMVWDGNLASKSARDHLVENGYAIFHRGMQALTGRGVLAFLFSPIVWRSALRRWWIWQRNPFIADATQIKRALT